MTLYEMGERLLDLSRELEAARASERRGWAMVDVLMS